jgi:hypothetical protein
MIASLGGISSSNYKSAPIETGSLEKQGKEPSHATPLLIRTANC